MLKLRKKTVVLGTAVLVLVGGGSALAYWTTTGSGSGSATNAAANGTLTLSATFADGLTPGASESVAYAASNPGTSSLFVGTITPTVAVDAAHDAAGCLATDFTATTVTSNTRVAAGATDVAVGSGSLSFADTAVNQDACKGATITLNLVSN